MKLQPSWSCWPVIPLSLLGLLGLGVVAVLPPVQAQGTARDREPFIRPITPLPPLFAKDDFLRVPWSSFGFHGRPARLFSRTATLIRQRPVKLRTNQTPVLRANPYPATAPDLRPDPSSFPDPGDDLSPLGRLMAEQAERTPPPLSSRSHAVPDFHSSGAMPQSAIRPERAAQIQAALVRFGYLSGAPSSSWDATSVAAMRKLQSDHRWQTKFVPDARALNLLGLGSGSEPP